MPAKTQPEAAATGLLTIDLAAVAANWRLLASRAQGAECAAVVKADGYGIGMAPAIDALLRAGCKTFFVANIVEGEQARAAAPGAVIYVLDGVAANASVRLMDARLRPVLASLAEIEEWAASSRAVGKRQPAAIQFDTGMNRLGLAAQEAALAAAARDIEATLVMSHFVCSQWPDDARNARQIAAFEAIRRHFPGVPASLCNSSGIFLPQRPHYDLVRPGYALYGGNPTPFSANPMRSVVRLEAPILGTRHIESGESVGYDATWTAKRATRLAIVGAGYGDGLPVAASGTSDRSAGEAVVGGHRCPFVGRVSMDLSVLDVTDAPETAAQRGAPVELLGETIGVDELAARSGTIGYEILTRLGRRYVRRYVEE